MDGLLRRLQRPKIMLLRYRLPMSGASVAGVSERQASAKVPTWHAGGVLHRNVVVFSVKLKLRFADVDSFRSIELLKMKAAC